MFGIKKKDYRQEILNLEDTIEPSEWLKNIVEKAKINTEGWKKRHYKKFRVDLLARLLKRMDILGHTKPMEKTYVKKLEEAVDILPTLREKNQEYNNKKYKEVISDVLKHYQMDHKLIVPYYHMVIAIVLGSFIGVLFLRDKIFIAGSIMFGLGFLGAIQDYRMKKAGKVI